MLEAALMPFIIVLVLAVKSHEFVAERHRPWMLILGGAGSALGFLYMGWAHQTWIGPAMATAVATIAVIELPNARRNAASDADEERMWERHANNRGRALSRPARLAGGIAYWRWPRGELALQGTRLSMKLADGRRVFEVDVTDNIGLSLRMWRRGHLHVDVDGATFRVAAGHANNMQLGEIRRWIEFWRVVIGVRSGQRHAS